MKHIQLPISEETVRELKIGDEVLISGVMVTARDAAHKFLIDHNPPEYQNILGGTLIYHCGPVVSKISDQWKFVPDPPPAFAKNPTKPLSSGILVFEALWAKAVWAK